MIKFLIVDDEPDVVDSVSELFTLRNYNVVTATSGTKALEMVKKESPNIIILDIRMPDISGMEVCRLLKLDSRTKHIPILMLSGKACEVGYKVEGLELGADDYLLKPVNIRVLLARVRSLLKVLTKPT